MHCVVPYTWYPWTHVLSEDTGSAMVILHTTGFDDKADHLASVLLQECLFSACIVEAAALMNMLQERVLSCQSCNSPNSPWLALSAMICFRRRVRSIVLSRSFARSLWGAHPAGDGFRLLGLLGRFIQSLDSSLLAAEDGIVQSTADLLCSTMVPSLLEAYGRKERVGLGVRQRLPTPALQHWHAVLRALLHRCVLNLAGNRTSCNLHVSPHACQVCVAKQVLNTTTRCRLTCTLSINLAEVMLANIIRKTLPCLCSVLCQKQSQKLHRAARRAQHEQHVIDTMYLCGAVHRLCRPHDVLGAPTHQLTALNGASLTSSCGAPLQANKTCATGHCTDGGSRPAVFQVEPAASVQLSESCHQLAMRIALSTCSAAMFNKIAMLPQNWNSASSQPAVQEQSAAASGVTFSSAWKWLTRDTTVPHYEVNVDQDTTDVLNFFGLDDEDCVYSWSTVSQDALLNAPTEMVVHALVDRAELISVLPTDSSDDSSEGPVLLRQLAASWPNFLTSSVGIEWHQATSHHDSSRCDV
jgi:hypothetical protein